MPELPEVTVCAERLQALVVGQPLVRLHIADPFLLRTVRPAPEAFQGKVLLSVGRMGKQLVLAYQSDLYMVVHLMLAGRLSWCPADGARGGRSGQATLDFPTGSVVLTESGSRRRASLHLVAGGSGLEAFRREGVDFRTATPAALAAALRRRSRTLKSALTDPDIVEGIGNAYSDEILHRARLSPFRLTGTLSDEEIDTLLAAGRTVLKEALEQLRNSADGGFPDHRRVQMAVHGRYGKPCPICGSPVQRIRYADHEANYCPGCQTGGRLLSDRSLSRLLRDDWPRTLAELEERRLPRG
jgi:formamidopyrimidine-DNA glycosylase